MLLFENCTIVDAASPEPREGHHVLIEGDRIREVADKPISSDATSIDCGGRTLMPGLTDAHAHITLTEVDVSRLEKMPLTLLTAHAARSAGAMLERGYTTIRDAGGADWGLQKAIDDDMFPGPRLLISGRALSQTGGHGDSRERTSDARACACANGLAFGTVVVDGVTEVRRAVRHELRKGANQIKVMASGGVISPNDPIDTTQFSKDELRAIVEEAEAWNTYVLAHAYSARAITHAVSCGVRSIEHGNLVDREAAELMAREGAFMVPTLVAYEALSRRGSELGLAPVSVEKLQIVLDAGLSSIEHCKAAGVKMGYGSDLLGELQVDQSRELSILADVLTPHEIIVSATATNAELFQREGEIGIISAGALADLLVVDGDPLSDLQLLQEQGQHLSVIMKGGKLYKNRLS